jgi:hypothetical protein
MKNLFTLIALILTLASCKNESKIKLQKTTITEVGNENIKTVSDSYLNSDYFEINLVMYSNEKDESKYYLAQKDLVKPEIGKDFKMEVLKIVDQNNEEMQFTNSTDFLNFMSQNGYEMQLQEKKEYRIEYTFKKK